MTQYLENLPTFLQEHTWLIYPLSVSGIAILLTYTYYLFYRKFQSKLRQNGHFIVGALLAAIQWPLIVFIWVEAITSVLNIFTSKLDEGLVYFAWKLREVGLIVLLAWVFMRFIKLFEEQLLSGQLAKKHPDETKVRAIGKLLRVLALIIVVLFILPVLGIPVSGIVAFGGGSAIVVGIGAQQILANYFGGLIIYSDRHFKVGDWIYSPDKKIEGKVEDIGWRTTQIRTFERRPLYVPNAVLSSIIVVNASRMTHRRIKETIGISYADAHALDAITQDIRSMLQDHPGIDQRQPLLVHFTAFGPYSFNVNIYTFAKTRDWKAYRDIQQDVFLKIIQIIDQHGATLAFPNNIIHLHSQGEIPAQAD